MGQICGPDLRAKFQIQARASTGQHGPSTGQARAQHGPARPSTGPARASTGPARASTGPARASTGPARASTGPARPSTGQHGPSTGPARAQHGPSTGQARAKHGPSTGQARAKHGKRKSPQRVRACVGLLGLACGQFTPADAATALATWLPCGLIQTDGREEDRPLQASLHAAQLTRPLVESERHSTVPAGWTGEA